MAKSDRVLGALRAMIVAGDLPPGSAIDRAALAGRLGASRQPVAAAIDRLAFEGVVEVIPQHGSFVSRLDGAVIEDWFLVRAGIEAEFAARFALQAATGARAALARNMRYQETALDAGDLAGFHTLDLEFHGIIGAVTPAPEAQAILLRAEANLGRVRRLLLPEPGRAARTLAEHRALHAALTAADAAAAGQAMRAHIETVAQMFRLFLASDQTAAAP